VYMVCLCCLGAMTLTALLRERILVLTCFCCSLMLMQSQCNIFWRFISMSTTHSQNADLD
jgi:hypothetical protein